MTLQQHLERNRARIEHEARQYAVSYRVSLDKARRDVQDEYVQGWHDEHEHWRLL